MMSLSLQSLLDFFATGLLPDGALEHPELLDGYVFRAAVLAAAKRYDDALAAYTVALAHDAAVDELRPLLGPTHP